MPHLGRLGLDRAPEIGLPVYVAPRQGKLSRGARWPKAHPTLGRIMRNDVADGLLLDVREMSIDDVELIDGSAFDRALERILASNDTCNFNSFNSSI